MSSGELSVDSLPVPGETVLTVATSEPLLTLTAGGGENSSVGRPAADVLPAVHADELTVLATPAVPHSETKQFRLHLVTAWSGPASLAVAVPGLPAGSVKTAWVGEAEVTVLSLPAQPAETLARLAAVAVLRMAAASTVRLVTERAPPARATVTVPGAGAVAVQTARAGTALRAQLSPPAGATATLAWPGAGALAARGTQGDRAEHPGPAGPALALEGLGAVAVPTAAQEEVALVTPGPVPANPALTLPGSLTVAVALVTPGGTHGSLTPRSRPPRATDHLSARRAVKPGVVLHVGLQTNLGETAGLPRELLAAGQLDRVLNTRVVRSS